MKKARREEGVSLFEVLVATALLGTVSAGVLPAFMLHFKTISENEYRSEAIAAAQVVLDQIRSGDPSLLPASGNGPTSAIAVGAHTYAVTPSYCTTPSLCTSTNTRQVAVTVTRNGTQNYYVETIFTKLR